MADESDFKREATQDDDEVLREVKREKMRGDVLHNLLRGSLPSERKRGTTFSDVWLY